MQVTKVLLSETSVYLIPNYFFLLFWKFFTPNTLPRTHFPYYTSACVKSDIKFISQWISWQYLYVHTGMRSSALIELLGEFYSCVIIFDSSWFRLSGDLLLVWLCDNDCEILSTWVVNIHCCVGNYIYFNIHYWFGKMKYINIPLISILD